MFKFTITGHLERDADALAKKLTDECSSVEELQKLVAKKLPQLFNDSEFEAIVVLKTGSDLAAKKIKEREEANKVDLFDSMNDIFEAIFGDVVGPFKPKSREV